MFKYLRLIVIKKLLLVKKFEFIDLKTYKRRTYFNNGRIIHS